VSDRGSLVIGGSRSRTFTADRDEDELVASFEEWAGSCLQVALAKWHKGL
jgi:hypothetical protein